MGTPAANDVEIEWQLDALDLRPVERWLAALPTDRGPAVFAENVSEAMASTLTAVPRTVERLVDVYMDTEDWRIGRSGFVLRVRHRNGRDEVTLKDRTEADNGLRRRLEVTEDLPTGGLASLGSEGPVGWRLQALAGQRPLLEVLDVKTRRRLYDLQVSGERVAEVALDDTSIGVRETNQPVRLQRVEVEVDPAWLDPLTPVVDSLRRECGLQSATLSKFEAGLLAAGLRVPSLPDLGLTTLPPNPTVGDLAFVVLRRNLTAMLAHEAGTRLGEDAEDLHDMRVATRRLRAALSLFAEALPVRAHHLRAELGWIADALGAVRDLDVQLERLDEWVRDLANTDRTALADLADLLKKQRALERASLLTCLDSTRYERLTAGFIAMVRQGPSRRSPAARAPALAVVPDLVAARHSAAVKAARRARRSGDPADLHRLRIRGKRLRYALEFVSPMYPGEMEKYIRQVVRLQDALGLMQDARVAAGRLYHLATSSGATLSPATVFVMGGIAQRYRHDSGRLAHKVPKLLDQLQGPKWRRLVAAMGHRRLELGALYRWPGAAPAETSARGRSSTSPLAPTVGQPPPPPPASRADPRAPEPATSPSVAAPPPPPPSSSRAFISGHQSGAPSPWPPADGTGTPTRRDRPMHPPDDRSRPGRPGQTHPSGGPTRSDPSTPSDRDKPEEP